jgi:hypothetical protein
MKQERESKMPKRKDWNEKLGAYTTDEVKMTRDTSGLGYPKPRDISKLVDPSHKRNDGFSAKLDKGE